MYRCPFCKTGLCLGGGLVWRLSSVLVGRGSDGLAAYKYDTIRYDAINATAIDRTHLETKHTLNGFLRGLVDKILLLPPPSVSGASVTAVTTLFDTILRRGCPVQVSDAPMCLSDSSNVGSAFSLLISICLARADVGEKRRRGQSATS